MINASTSTNFTASNCSNVNLDSLFIKVIKTMAYCMILLLSVVGNGFIVAVIYRKRKLRSSINLLIWSMSASDIFMQLSIIPLRIKDVFYHQGQWFVYGVIGEILCKVTSYLHTTGTMVSIVTMLIIAVERFFSVVFPLKKPPIRTKRACYALIVFSWCFSALSASPNLFNLSLIKLDNIHFCSYNWEPIFNHKEAVKVEMTVFFVVFTIVPFIFLTSLYTAIIISLYSQNVSPHLASEELKRRAQENKRVTFMLLTVVVIFLLSWAPVNTYAYISYFVLNTHLPCELRNLLFAGMFLSYTYPAINPFVYYVFNEHYKSAIQEIINRSACCNKKRTREETSIEIRNLRVTIESGLSQASMEN